MLKNNYILCHYGEIGLKGKNREFFEKKLVENIKKSLDQSWFKSVKRISGRILISLSPQAERATKKISKSLKNIFGIVNFSFAVKIEQDLKNIQETALLLLQKKKFNSFKIQTQRSNKEFPFNSPEVNQKVGAFIVENLNKKVDLESPNLTCFIEIVEDFAFLSLQKEKGSGGLPVGVSSKAVSLLSGGIDSPVASFDAQKRGVYLIFVHFHSYPYTEKQSIEKNKTIVKILNKFQFKSKLHLVPFAEIQKQILLNCSAKLRVILYRRFMFKIAEQIARKENAQALVTGESIGQVASQTLPNLKVIEEIISIPVLRPLITQDKTEIIDKAKEIGTYQVSILPAQDCCSRFLPQWPATKAKLEEVKKEESKLKKNKLIQRALDSTSMLKIAD